jgi:hypothetical protein
MKPSLLWVHKEPGTKLRYYEAHLFDCHMYVNPQGWSVHYSPKHRQGESRENHFLDSEGHCLPVPPVEECMVQAEDAARELLQTLKDSGEFEAWTALWSKP